MKMTIDEAYKAAVALRSLSQVSLPATVAYRVSKLSRKFSVIAEDVDKAREAAIKKHGIPIEGQPGRYGLKDPVAFNEEMKPLFEREEEIDIPGDKIDLTALADAKLPASVFTDLDWLFSEDGGW